jgi:hypothetical protein
MTPGGNDRLHYLKYCVDCITRYTRHKTATDRTPAKKISNSEFSTDNNISTDTVEVYNSISHNTSQLE